jgi:CBS domain-containing protein
MKVKELMSRNLISIDVNNSMRNVIKLMKKHNVSRLLVKDEDRVVGIITQRDISERLGNWRERRLSDSHVHVSAAYTKDIINIDKERNISTAASLILDRGISSLAVSENGNIIGIITKTDLIKSLLNSKIPVKNYMSKPVISLSVGSTLLRARRLMLDKKIKRIFITLEGRLVGTLTESDIAKALGLFRKMAKGRQWDEKLKRILVEDVMNKDVIIIKDNSMLSDAVKIMLKKNISGLPVMKNGKLVGIITKTDLVRAVRDLKS